MPSSGCTLTRPRAGAQTGRNKNNPRFPEIGGCIFAVNLYKLLCAGTRKNPERRREHQESGKALAPLRSARNPPNLQANSKNIPSPHQAKSTHYLMFSRRDRMREAGRDKRKQAPEPDGGGACVWILNLSLWSSVNALYHSNIEKNISQYVTINCNFYKCTFKLKALDNTARLNVCYM